MIGLVLSGGNGGRFFALFVPVSTFRGLLPVIMTCYHFIAGRSQITFAIGSTSQSLFVSVVLVCADEARDALLLLLRSH